MEPLISVIIPVYNIENYLHDCVQSLLSQTYRNLELLLIDDGSTDASGCLCDKWQQTDRRIRVIHKPNGGVADSRNTGLDAIQGEYYCFVDGDDTVQTDYIETMYSLLNEYDADIAMCMYSYTWEDGSTKRTRNGEFSDEHIFMNTGNDALMNMLYSRIYAPACWGKLFRNDGNVVRFPHYAIGEDMLFTTEHFLRAEKVIMSNRPLYNYMQHDASVMHSVNPDKIYDLVVSGDEMLKKIPSASKDLQHAASYYIIEKNTSALMKLYEHPDQSDKIRHIKDNIKAHRKTVLFDSNAEFRTRIACAVSYFGIPTLYKIRNLTAKRRK